MTQLLLRSDLPRSKEDKKLARNNLSSYFPIRTKDKKDVFDWDSALGYVVKISYKKELGKFDLASFEQACESRFKRKLDEEGFWCVLQDMYFKNGELFKISPEFLLFKTLKGTGKPADARLGGLFASLLQNFFFEAKPNTQLNFIEKQLYDELLTHIKIPKNNKPESSQIKFSSSINESPYLPFLATHFQKDLRFLGKRPKYLLTVFKEYLRLYAHLYTVQLSLNLKDWRAGEPEAKPNYYIVDSEKASEERSFIKDYGFTQLSKAFWNIFPYLSMNESLQEPNTRLQPLWAMANNLNQNSGSLVLLNDYVSAFKDNRELNTAIKDAEDPLDALENLLKLSVAQFAPGESRNGINLLYIRAVEAELCSHFVQSRGRAGRVLVFNQDYLILLTNLAIGEQEQLRFHELIKAFESRGVFFDKQSQQVLIEIYERIGNVERMSDSGDAVYVRKTI
jgi:DNA phosphorothioation-dependent restriction protein DptG